MQLSLVLGYSEQDGRKCLKAKRVKHPGSCAVVTSILFAEKLHQY